MQRKPGLALFVGSGVEASAEASSEWTSSGFKSVLWQLPYDPEVQLMTALAGFLSFVSCSQLAVQFSARRLVHGFCRLPRGQCNRSFCKVSVLPSRMQSSFAAEDGPDDEMAVELEVEKGTKSGYTILVDYGKGESRCQDPASPATELKLWQALQQLDPERFPSVSSAKKTIRKGTVLVDGKPGRVDSKVTFGVNHLKLQHRTSTSFKPIGDPPFHVDIVYEDDYMAVVHKPPGVNTHPMPGEGGKEMAPAMAQALTWFVKTAPDGTPGALWKPMVIHRLDKPTEGLLMVVKTKQAWTSLQARPDAHLPMRTKP